MKTTLIAGASGLVGSELLKLLIDSDAYKTIHVLSRRSLEVKSSKIVEHIVNFDELEKFEPDSQIDHIFCTVGTTIKKAKTKEKFRIVDYDYVLALGKKAKQWNSEKFLMISSLGANAKSAIFYNRIKGEIEIALKKLELSHLLIFRPSLLLGDRKEHRAGEKTAINVYKFMAPIFVGPIKKYKGIEAGKVAKAMIHTALNNNEPIKIIKSDEIQKF